jgi:hypothetical protein
VCYKKNYDPYDKMSKQQINMCLLSRQGQSDWGCRSVRLPSSFSLHKNIHQTIHASQTSKIVT